MLRIRGRKDRLVGAVLSSEVENGDSPEQRIQKLSHLFLDSNTFNLFSLLVDLTKSAAH